MARRVAMERNRTALQAVLSGLAGGFQGLAQRQARDEETRRYEDQRLREGKRDAAAAERQTVMDALALAEQGYIEQGERARIVDAAKPAVVRVLGSVASAMAGAPTGFDPADTETVAAAAPAFGTPVSSLALGGKTYERTETPTQAALRKANAEAARVRQTRQETLAERSAQANAEVAQKRTTLAGAFPKLTAAQVDAVAQGLAKPEDFPAYAPVRAERSLTPFQSESLARDDADRDAQGMVFLSAHRQDPEVMNALSTLFGNNPAMAKRPGLAAYQIMQQMGAAGKLAATEAQVDQRTAAAEAARARAGAIGAPTGLQARLDAMRGRPGATPAGAGVPAAAPSPSGTLEQQFPDRAAQIQQARAAGYSEADILAYLRGGR